ncbi:MAG: hypothetical protein OXL41_02480 [Nitrospinae bacterium]|nr:hypothetical protein [Nitrospinota bacterium]
MHSSLKSIQEELKTVIHQLKEHVPSDDPFSVAHGNWAFPGLSRAELVEEAQSVIDFIEDHETDDLGDSEALITDYVRRLTHLHQQTVPNMWGNAGQAVPAYELTIDGLRKALSPVLKEDKSAETMSKLRALRKKLVGLEATLKELEPRTAALSTMVGRIESAYNAADQLPADLESLAEARDKISGLVDDATQDQGRIVDIRKAADDLDKQLKDSAEEAGAVLERCETAYSAATSVGLAAAFDERSKTLSRSMWFWIAGLFVALVSGTYFGTTQIGSLSQALLGPSASQAVILIHVLLSILSVGAPVWFAWLATKQIGQRFRLSEDYAFKASVSRAYEGFRRETARFDEDMEAKLLASALARLDELPLRLVEVDSHGSPWHELASSDVMKRAMKNVPGFAGQVKELAGRATDSVRPNREDQRPASSPTRSTEE